jgi:hypothetical protein
MTSHNLSCKSIEDYPHNQTHATSSSKCEPPKRGKLSRDLQQVRFSVCNLGIAPLSTSRNSTSLEQPCNSNSTRPRKAPRVKDLGSHFKLTHSLKERLLGHQNIFGIQISKVVKSLKFHNFESSSFVNPNILSSNATCS